MRNHGPVREDKFFVLPGGADDDAVADLGDGYGGSEPGSTLRLLGLQGQGRTGDRQVEHPRQPRVHDRVNGVFVAGRANDHRLVRDGNGRTEAVIVVGVLWPQRFPQDPTPCGDSLVDIGPTHSAVCARGSDDHAVS